MNRSIVKLALLFSLCCSQTFAQENKAHEQHDPLVRFWNNVAPRNHGFLDLQRAGEHDGEINLATSVFWAHSANLFTAKDGNYVAQNAEELQTYYDLKMEYQYIESQTIRNVLGLNDGEGIIIKSCEKDGAGYLSGFRAGDVVLKVGDQAVATQYEFVIAITKLRAQGKGTASIQRSGEVLEIDFSIEPVKIEKSYRWIIGVSVDEMNDLLRSHLRINGAVVTAITPDSPSEKMSIMVNDIIMRIDDKEIHNLENLRSVVQQSKGSPVKIDLLRSGNKMSIELTPQKIEDVADVRVKLSHPVIRQYFQLEPDAISDLLIQSVNKDQHWDEKRQFADTVSVLDSLTKQIEDLRQQVIALKKTMEK